MISDRGGNRYGTQDRLAKTVHQPFDSSAALRAVAQITGADYRVRDGLG